MTELTQLDDRLSTASPKGASVGRLMMPSADLALGRVARAAFLFRAEPTAHLVARSGRTHRRWWRHASSTSGARPRSGCTVAVMESQVSLRPCDIVESLISPFNRKDTLLLSVWMSFGILIHIVAPQPSGDGQLTAHCPWCGLRVVTPHPSDADCIEALRHAVKLQQQQQQRALQSARAVVHRITRSA